MKRFLLVSLLLTLFISVMPKVHAATATPTPKVTEKPTITKASTEKLNKQINNLKDRIASRVAELNLVERRGLIGTVNSASDTQITITDADGQTVIIEVDPITKFSSLSKKEDFGVSDIEKSSKISVLGIYNKQTRRVLARFIDEVAIPLYVRGTVASTDEEAGTITVSMEGNKSVIVDIETITKTSEYIDGEVEKSGFSKITVGSRVAIQGYPDKKDKNRVVATRVLLFPGLPKNPKIVVPDKALQDKDTPVTSTGSGKKLTPIR